MPRPQLGIEPLDAALEPRALNLQTEIAEAQRQQALVRKTSPCQLLRSPEGAVALRGHGPRSLTHLEQGVLQKAVGVGLDEIAVREALPPGGRDCGRAVMSAGELPASSGRDV